jgi:hypothetical protein
MAGFIAAVIAIFGLLFQFVGIAAQAAVLILKVLIGAFNLIIWVGNFSFTVVQSILLWVDAWLGPIGGAIKFVLSPAEVYRAAMLALTFATTIWFIFSTVFNDAFYILINPFFLNLFTEIGHFGFAIVSGGIIFVVDLIRRLFQGPTKAQLKMLEELETKQAIAKVILK